VSPDDRRLLAAYAELTGEDAEAEAGCGEGYVEAVLEDLRAIWRDPSCAEEVIGSWCRFAHGDSPGDFARRLAQIMSDPAVERIEPPGHICRAPDYGELSQRVAKALAAWGTTYRYTRDIVPQTRAEPATVDEIAAVIRKEMER